VIRAGHLVALCCLLAFELRGSGEQPRPPADAPPPNVILIFADDLGYADIGPFSMRHDADRPRTPNLDRMASEGVRLTNFYVAQAVCSASRAAILTGAYPNRIGIEGALMPTASHGLNRDETTIAELLKARGYATAIYGKWHLGHHTPFLPIHHGFDEYLGLPYSNDMSPNHPLDKTFPPLPFIEGDRVIERDPDQSLLTRRYTERAVRFVEQHRGQPFFLYVPHAMPHVPLFVSNRFKGTTGASLYADVIAELDWSVGEILDAVQRSGGLDEQTLVIFTSDNGPWLLFGDHAGSAGPFREGKGTAFEGGVRVPFIARWPGRIPPSTVSHAPAMAIDLLPTFARLAGAPLPGERVIDGRDIWPLLSQPSAATSPHDALYLYWGAELHAVRSGRWKLHLAHPYQSLEAAGGDGHPGKYVRKEIELSLFDLENDPGESVDVASQYPDVIARLMQHVEYARWDLGDALTGRTGKNVRPAGKLF
jgi:arylsulfatase A